MLNDEIRTVEESYLSATTTSNLRVEADRKTDADVLIAAGWTPGILGSALMRLQSEWDCSAKPKRATAGQIAAFAVSMPGSGERGGEMVALTDKERLAMAHDVVNAWYMSELQILRLRLKSLPRVHEQITHWSRTNGAKDAEEAANRLISYWLDDTCHVCHGRGKMLIDSTPVLGEQCKACHGSGKHRVPMGEFGRRAVAMLDECVQVARASMKKRLRSTMVV